VKDNGFPCPPVPRHTPVSPVEGSSLTTSLRYQELSLFFCNQLAYGRLVIRRAVEVANPRSVGLFVIPRFK